MRCRVAILARQPMGFLRDKSLKRVRAGPAVAPPEPWPCACGQTSKHPARRSPRARQQARLHAEEFRPPPPSQNPKIGRAPSRSALAAGKQRRPAPTQRPLPHRGKAAPNPPHHSDFHPNTNKKRLPHERAKPVNLPPESPAVNAPNVKPRPGINYGHRQPTDAPYNNPASNARALEKHPPTACSIILPMRPYCRPRCIPRSSPLRKRISGALSILPRPAHRGRFAAQSWPPPERVAKSHKV